jgi:hypothetical protein
MPARARRPLNEKKLSCLLPELEFYPQVKPFDGLTIYVLTDGTCFLVDRLDEEPCFGFFWLLVVLDDEVLFAL